MRKKYKFITTVCMTAMILSCVIGCGNNSSSNVEEGTEEEYGLEEENEELEYEEYVEENEDLSIYKFQSESNLEGNAVIRPNCMLLITTEGTVIGKGDSSFGELGNGERTYCENWTVIPDLEGIKKIYADKSLGNTDDDGKGFGLCYALAENGCLYRWGGNILRPEIFLEDIDDFYRCGGDSNDFNCLVLEYKDGHKELKMPDYNFSNYIFDVTDIVQDNQILYAGIGLSCGEWDGESEYPEIANYIIIKDRKSGMTYLLGLNIEELEEIDGKYRITRVKATESCRYEIGNEIAKVSCIDREEYNNSQGDIIDGDAVYVISEEGAINDFVIDGDSILFLDDWEGWGYVYYHRLKRNVFAIHNNNVNTIGDNEYGQLGDGTKLDYYDDWIVVDEFSCIELYDSESDWGTYCVALDDYNNIWCWGGKFGEEPHIEISSELNAEYY